MGSFCYVSTISGYFIIINIYPYSNVRRLNSYWTTSGQLFHLSLKILFYKKRRIWISLKDQLSLQIYLFQAVYNYIGSLTGEIPLYFELLTFNNHWVACNEVAYSTILNLRPIQVSVKKLFMRQKSEPPCYKF